MTAAKVLNITTLTGTVEKPARPFTNLYQWIDAILKGSTPVAKRIEGPYDFSKHEQRRFQLFGTGTGPIRDGLDYVGTCMFANGDLVIHLYEDVAGTETAS